MTALDTSTASPLAQHANEHPQGIKISPLDSRYLSTDDGKTFIPVGLNLCFPRFVTDPAEGVQRTIGWMRELAANGGNFVRFWLGHSFLDIEPELAGRFDQQAMDRIGILLDTAQELGLRVKLTFEHFRTLETAQQAEAFAGAASFSRPQYAAANGGPANNMDEYWQSPAARRAFLNKLDHLAARFATHPAIIACELWNEVNACTGKGWDAWTEAMLPEVKNRFPHALALQSLGSFCAEHSRPPYQWLAKLADNDILQVHRYLDLGAPWEICHQSIDQLSADAIRELRDMAPDKPLLLAEGGAVEPNHAGPFALYAQDAEGIILHDVIFAPFFAGSAGSGQCWHWDFYVAKQHLWWHFARFQRAIEGFDPAAQSPRSLYTETGQLRVYLLLGNTQSLLWLRNKASNWEAELQREECPQPLANLQFALPPAPRKISAASAYNPWDDTQTADLPIRHNCVTLPPFQRSLVMKICH